MALRRQVRLRKEYIYRKSLQGKDAQLYEDKRRVREALRDGLPLPTELRANEVMLRHEVRNTPNLCGTNKHTDLGYSQTHGNLHCCH